jgi:hypothetical protein
VVREGIDMSELYLFLTEIGISLFISVCVVFLLNKSFRNILIDLCGTEVRAQFWMIYSNLMLIIAPLLTSVIFGTSNKVIEVSFTFYKTAFGSALFGVFVSLIIIGLQITKYIPKIVHKPMGVE